MAYTNVHSDNLMITPVLAFLSQQSDYTAIAETCQALSASFGQPLRGLTIAHRDGSETGRVYT